MQQLCGSYCSNKHILSLLWAAQLPPCCRCGSRVSTENKGKVEERRGCTIVSRHSVAASGQSQCYHFAFPAHFNGQELEFLDAGSIRLECGPGTAVIACE